MADIPIIGQSIPMIEGDNKKRAQKCLQQVKAVLERYDCVIIPVVTIAGNKIISAMDIQAKVRKIPGRTNN